MEDVIFPFRKKLMFKKVNKIIKTVYNLNTDPLFDEWYSKLHKKYCVGYNLVQYFLFSASLNENRSNY